MEYALAAVLIVVVIYGIVKAANGNRYTNMTEKEFEAEAQRGSRIGGAVAQLQKFVDPSHHVEYIQEQQERVEAEGAELGDKPETGSHPAAPK